MINRYQKTDGGPTFSLHGITQALANLGIKSTIFSASIDHDMLIHGVHHMHMRFSSLHRILNGKYSVIHIHGLWSPGVSMCALLCILFRKKYCISPRGMFEPWSLSQGLIKKRLARFLYQDFILRKAHCLVVSSIQEKKNIETLLSDVEFRIVPNLCEDLQSLTQNTHHVRSEIVYVSRIHKKKGLDILIKAFALALKECPDLTLKVYGRGEQKYVNYIVNLIGTLGLQSRIHLKGEVYGQEKAFVLSRSGVCVLSSWSENFGNIVSEALSVGLPVIVSDNMPWQDVEDNGCGLVSSVDIISIAQALKKIYKMEDDDYNRMRWNARNYFLQNLSDTIITNKLETIYNEFI